MSVKELNTEKISAKVKYTFNNFFFNYMSDFTWNLNFSKLLSIILMYLKGH